MPFRGPTPLAVLRQHETAAPPPAAPPAGGAGGAAALPGQGAGRPLPDSDRARRGAGAAQWRHPRLARRRAAGPRPTVPAPTGTHGRATAALPHGADAVSPVTAPPHQPARALSSLVGREREGRGAGILRGPAPAGGAAADPDRGRGHRQDAPGAARRRGALRRLPGWRAAGGAGAAGRSGAGPPGRGRGARACARRRAGRRGDASLQTLREQRLLLVLDNCEHLVGRLRRAGRGAAAGLPRLQVLATSRERLGVPGETTWRVPALAVPGRPQRAASRSWPRTRRCACSSSAPRGAPGFALTERTRAPWRRSAAAWTASPWRSSWPRRGCGSAAWSRSRPGWTTGFRLLTGGSRTALPHQQTLRAAMDWSYDLLAAPERRLLQPPGRLRRRLDAGGGGGGLRRRRRAAGSAAAAGCPEDVLDVLAAWWRSRWSSPARGSRATGSGERSGATACWRRCASTPGRSWPPAGRRSATRRATPPTSSRWRRRRSRRSTARSRRPGWGAWSASTTTCAPPCAGRPGKGGDAGGRDAETGLRLGSALAKFWTVRGYQSEGQRWLDAALARAGGAAGRAGRGRATRPGAWPAPGATTPPPAPATRSAWPCGGRRGPAGGGPGPGEPGRRGRRPGRGGDGARPARGEPGPAP